MSPWAVAVGAAIGAPARFLIDALISQRFGRDQPWGTLVVNVSGAAILGILVGLLARGAISTSGFALVGTGFCGAFTTFSTFIWETLALAEDRRFRSALMNVVLTLVFGLAVACGAYLLSSPPGTTLS